MKKIKLTLLLIAFFTAIFVVAFSVDDKLLYPLNKEISNTLVDTEEKVGDSTEIRLLVNISKKYVTIVNRNPRPFTISYMALISSDLQDRCVLVPPVHEIKSFEHSNTVIDCEINPTYLQITDQYEFHYFYSVR